MATKNEITEIVYLNEKHNLNTCAVSYVDVAFERIFTCQIPEDNLVVGYIYEGVPQFGEQLRYLPFTPLEKHLFQSNNVHFNIARHHFRIENTVITWKIELGR